MEAPAPRPARTKSAKQQLQKQTSLEGAKSGASSTHGGLVDHALDTLDDAAAAGQVLEVGVMPQCEVSDLFKPFNDICTLLSAC